MELSQLELQRMQKEYIRNSIKKTKAEETWGFLKECRINGVFPSLISKIKLPIQSKSVLKKTKQICLRVATTEAKRRFHKLQRQQEDSYCNLLQEMSDLTGFFSILEERIKHLRQTLKRKYIKKLKWIFRKQLGPPRRTTLELHQVLTVIGDIEVPHFVKTLLTRGPSYALWDNKNVLDDIPIFEEILREIEDSEKDRLRWSFLSQKTRLKNTPKEREAKYERDLLKRTLWWLKNNQYSITREDKNKKMVLMKKADYHSFLYDYICTMQPTEILADPTKTIATKLDKIIKNKDFPSFWNVPKQEAPACLRLFAFIKTHKIPVQAMPIVEKRQAPTYQFEKVLAKWCNKTLGQIDTSITITTSVLERIRAMPKRDDDTYTSYDFQALSVTEVGTSLPQLLQVLVGEHPTGK